MAALNPNNFDKSFFLLKSLKKNVPFGDANDTTVGWNDMLKIFAPCD